VRSLLEALALLDGSPGGFARCSKSMTGDPASRTTPARFSVRQLLLVLSYWLYCLLGIVALVLLYFHSPLASVPLFIALVIVVVTLTSG
jgi:hypothetical protein